MSEHPLRIFSGSAHPALAKEIASLLNVELGKSATSVFPDSEIHVEFDEVKCGHSIFSVCQAGSHGTRARSHQRAGGS